ncbi:putative major facilitator superfamily, MFS transporter superfamily [Septoria linicola]|nr:putative major facilitator superfamily, MFS transporter superfamily [Septoria linicola]
MSDQALPHGWYTRLSYYTRPEPMNPPELESSAMTGMSSGVAKLLNTLQIPGYQDYSVEPAGLRWRSNTFFIVATVAIGLFTDLFLYGLIVPVLPFMLQDRVGVPEEQVQSLTSGLLAAYAAASVVFSPVAGILADKVATRQAPFLFGLLALLASTILLFLGTTVPILALARVLQGISAAFVWTIGLALCLETVGPENLGKTIGSIFSFIAVGNLAAPILGGVLYEKTGIAGVFALGASILAVDFVMRLLVIEKKIANKYYAEDPSTVSDLNTSRNDNETNDQSQDSEAQTNGNDNDEEQPLLGGKHPDDSYYKLKPKDEYPRLVRIIPILPCLSDPMLLTALLVAMVQAILLGSFDSTIPTVAKQLFDFSSLRSGLLFIPLGVFDFILGPVFGWCVDRYGTKPVAVLSYAYLVPVLICLRIPHEGGMDQIIVYSVLLGLCGMGLAGIGAPSIVEAGAIVQKYYEVNPDYFGEKGPYAQLYGMSNMVFSFGLTVGPELAGELKQAIGYGNMNVVLAAVCLITSVLSFAFIGGKPKVLRRERRNTHLSRKRA